MSDARPVSATVASEAGRLLDPRGLDVGALMEAMRDPRPCTVVVPVHNGGSVVSACLEALERHTPHTRVVVIDDGSTDGAIITDLDARAAKGSVELIRHPDNQGYTRTANQALQLGSGGDVVLLNSDTEVGPGWLAGLRQVACSHAAVATVTAVSDQAGAMSMPVSGVANHWPVHLSWAEIARAALQAELPWSIEVPTGNGFCMLVTAAAVSLLGGFDEQLFPRGYGEENDFCMRARAAGMVNLLAPRVFVRHHRSQSFGAEREELARAGRAVVDARHADYTAAVRSWQASTEMTDLRASFDALRTRLRGQAAVPPRRLYVLHRSTGGTPATNLDLMTALAGRQESYLLESVATRGLALSRVSGTGTSPLVRWEADRPFAVTDTWRQDYAEVVCLLLVNLGIELVHIRHLINHPLTTLPTVVARLGIPLVVSTHDFYLSCPTVHLLDDNDQFCGGHCTPGQGRCRLPTPFLEAVPPLKHVWIHEWRRRVGSVLDAAAAVIATTAGAAETMASSYPDHASRMHVIEHGRDLGDAFAPLRSDEQRRPGPVRIIAVANWDVHKGSEYVRRMAQGLGPQVEWHLLGQRSDQLADIGIVHGPFSRDTQREIWAAIDPDLSALVSIWPETYSHTLSESWAFGIPVIATDIGAVAERVRAHGGGVLLPVDNPEAAARQVSELLAHPHALSALRARVPRDAVRSRMAMAESYLVLYDEIEHGSRVRQVGPLAEVGASR